MGRPRRAMASVGGQGRCRSPRMVRLLGLILAAMLAIAAPAAGQALVYDADLSFDGVAISGTADLRFTLFDQPAGGTPLSETVEAPSVVLVNGHAAMSLPLSPPPGGPV